MMETKKEIRKRILDKRDNLSVEVREAKSASITERLLSRDEYINAENVLCFITYKSEVSTDEIIAQSIRDGKKVYAPTVCGYDMRFFEIASLSELVEGYKGIREPNVDEEKAFICEANSNKKNLIIMPGSVFDTERNRIGYGKGFYDRFLANGYVGAKVAIAFDEQIVEAGSFEIFDTDIKPDYIITDKKVIL